jgi:hypothetical protein
MSMAPDGASIAWQISTHFGRPTQRRATPTRSDEVLNRSSIGPQDVEKQRQLLTTDERKKSSSDAHFDEEAQLAVVPDLLQPNWPSDPRPGQNRRSSG